MRTRTKGQLVDTALRRAGIASSAMLLGPEPESVADALEDLETMMAQWEGEGVALGYAFTGNQSPEPSENSGLPSWAWSAVAHNLAIRCLIDNQRPIPSDLATLAYNEKLALNAQDISIPSLQRRNDMPRGTGNRGMWGNRYYHETDGVQDGNGQDIDL